MSSIPFDSDFIYLYKYLFVWPTFHNFLLIQIIYISHSTNDWLRHIHTNIVRAISHILFKPCIHYSECELHQPLYIIGLKSIPISRSRSIELITQNVNYFPVKRNTFAWWLLLLWYENGTLVYGCGCGSSYWLRWDLIWLVLRW